MRDDDYEPSPPSDLALASVWPLLEYEQHVIHSDTCSIFEGDCCDCDSVRVVGPTGFA